jgi:hypothetical protein
MKRELVLGIRSTKLFGVPEIELDLKAQTIKVDDLFIGEFQVA